MNNIVIGVLLLLLFTYFGGSSVPTLLKDNKKYLLGFAVGVVGYPLMRIEGIDNCRHAENPHLCRFPGAAENEVNNLLFDWS